MNELTHLCKNKRERSVIPVLTCCGNFEALVFGYMNGESVSTSNRSNGRIFSSRSFRTPVSDLSLTIENLILVGTNQQISFD